MTIRKPLVLANGIAQELAAGDSLYISTLDSIVAPTEGVGSTIIVRGRSGGAPNTTGLRLLDTDDSHTLRITCGSDLTANRTLNILPGDVATRTLDISAANVTITAAGAALIDDADVAAQQTTLSLVPGVNVQAYDVDLTTWAEITPGTGVGTFLATPSSANLLAALTTKTGTGNAVFSAAPTLTGITNTGAIQASDAISVSAWSAFGSGNRGHMYFNAGAFNLLGYNATTATYLPTIITGSTTTIGSGATTVAVFDAAKLDVTGRVTATTYMKSGVYTVATLPAAATAGAGAIAYVTDALAPTFLGAVVGGGAVATTVYSDGTTWKAG